MDKEEIIKKVREEEDYIRSPKDSNSLVKFLAKNSEGVENSTIARLLMTSEEEVNKIYQEAVVALREDLDDEEPR